MKKFLLLILCFTVFSFADDFWTRTHYFGLSFNGFLTTGDLSENKKISLDEEIVTEVFHFPDFKHSFIPEAEVGVNMNAHTFAFVVGLYTFESDYSYFRLGADYRYYLFWPNPLQIGFGINYTYMRIDSKDNVETSSPENENPVLSDGVLMGNGVSALSSVRYYFTEHLGVEFSLKYRFFYYSSLNTKESGSCSIDESLHQHFGEAGIKLIFEM